MNDDESHFNRVRVINRSLRCFVFGWFSLIPLVGLGTAWLALKWHRQIALETNDRWNPYLLYACSICGFVVLIGYLVLFGIVPAILVATIFAALQIYLICRHYFSTSEQRWNPARRYAYWGLGLAYAGYSLTIVIFVSLVVEFIKRV